MLLFDWSFWARDEQLPPSSSWNTWLVLAGRGFGKTRTGAEWVRQEIESGRRQRIALIGPTASDTRDVMVEGESGLLNVCPPWNRPKYEPSKRRVVWPSGRMAILYSAEEPERLRGPQHDGAWCDEPASWKYPESWDQMQFGLRLGDCPQVVVTGTPKPIKLIRDLVKDPMTAVTRGSTYANIANLPEVFIRKLSERYENTRLGRQEINAEILEDVEGALWNSKAIESSRLSLAEYQRLITPPDETRPAELEILRLVVAIDPAASHGEESDETGLCAAGRDQRGHYYVLHLDGYRLSPNSWATKAVDLYDRFKADRLIAEINNGGEMVVSTIRGVRREIPVRVVHATRGKVTRAEPIAALYEQGKVHHVGLFARAEEQMYQFPVVNDMDDMVDSLVWALTDLSSRGDGKVEHGAPVW